MYYLKLNGDRVVDIIKNPPPNLEGGVYVESMPTCEVNNDEIAEIYYINNQIEYKIKRRNKL